MNTDGPVTFVQNAHKQRVRYTTSMENEIQIAVTVASKETDHQEFLTLPTSVGSAEMKNYRKGKKQAVSPALERGKVCRILETQL